MAQDNNVLYESVLVLSAVPLFTDAYGKTNVPLKKQRIATVEQMSRWAGIV